MHFANPLDEVKLSFFDRIRVWPKGDFSVVKHRLKYADGFVMLFTTPLAILDLVMMCIGFMFLGVYPLSVPAS